MELSSRLLAGSALIALPTVFAPAWLYSRWSSKGALMAPIGVSALGLGDVIQLELATGISSISPVWSLALLIVGSDGIIAMLLPFAAESYPLHIRGCATGWVAACTKGGGLLAQLLGLLALAPALLLGATLVLVPVPLSLALAGWFCIETRARDLRDFDVDPVRL